MPVNPITFILSEFKTTNISTLFIPVTNEELLLEIQKGMDDTKIIKDSVHKHFQLFKNIPEKSFIYQAVKIMTSICNTLEK